VADFPFINTDADRFDEPFRSKARKRLPATINRLPEDLYDRVDYVANEPGRIRGFGLCK